jgi:cell division transport system permease protein
MKRITRYGFIGFLRNGFVSLAAIAVMTITLFVMASIVVSGAALNAVLVQLTEKVDINVYFTIEAPDEDMLALKQQIEALPEVAQVTYVSRDQALANFEARHANDQLTLQALQELKENPLSASLAIRAKETTQYENIARFLDASPALAEGESRIVEKVNFSQVKSAIDRLTNIITASERMGLAAAIILAIATIMIAFNTIRLAIYTSKDEIAVMRLVGASRAYVRGPFIIAGLLYGVVSGVLVLAALYPLSVWAGPASEKFFGTFNTFTYYSENFAFLCMVVLGAGVILGVFSSYLAVRRYLK